METLLDINKSHRLLELGVPLFKMSSNRFSISDLLNVMPETVTFRCIKHSLYMMYEQDECKWRVQYYHKHTHCGLVNMEGFSSELVDALGTCFIKIIEQHAYIVPRETDEYDSNALIATIEHIIQMCKTGVYPFVTGGSIHMNGFRLLSNATTMKIYVFSDNITSVLATLTYDPETKTVSIDGDPEAEWLIQYRKSMFQNELNELLRKHNAYMLVSETALKGDKFSPNHTIKELSSETGDSTLYIDGNN